MYTLTIIYVISDDKIYELFKFSNSKLLFNVPTELHHLIIIIREKVNSHKLCR